jgi:hypothetical protein
MGADLPGPHDARAAIDRLIHHSVIIELNIPRGGQKETTQINRLKNWIKNLRLTVFRRSFQLSLKGRAN